MRTKRFTIPLLTIALAAPLGLATVRAHAAPASPAAGFYQDRHWDEAPDDFRDAKRQGFHDGIEAARRDWESHHRRDADDHEMFKHPPVDRRDHHMVEDYREGFRRGYQTGMEHMRDEHHDHDHM